MLHEDISVYDRDLAAAGIRTRSRRFAPGSRKSGLATSGATGAAPSPQIVQRPRPRIVERLPSADIGEHATREIGRHLLIQLEYRIARDKVLAKSKDPRKSEARTITRTLDAGLFEKDPFVFDVSRRFAMFCWADATGPRAIAVMKSSIPREPRAARPGEATIAFGAAWKIAIRWLPWTVSHPRGASAVERLNDPRVSGLFGACALGAIATDERDLSRVSIGDFVAWLRAMGCSERRLRFLKAEASRQQRP